MAQDSHNQTTSNPPSNSWTEPPWTGWIETTGDALLILEAARRGLIPRVTRRLVDSERKMITSGSVFVFDEDESGIKRWTDGFFWSPSRILGNFLLYRETEKRGAGHRSARAEQAQQAAAAAAAAAAQEEHQVQFADGKDMQSLSRPKSESSRMGIDRQRERSLVGSLTNSIGGVAQHLISYYKVEDVEQGRLRAPSTLPELASLDISPEYLDKTHFRNPPKVEIGVDGIPRYRGEGDDADTSPQLVAAPLSMPMYGDQDGSGKRSKRYDPYSGTAPKRSRKSKSGADPHAGADAHAVQQPQPGYSDGATMHTYAPYSYYQLPPPSVYLPPMYSQPPYPALPPPPSSSSPIPAHTPSPSQVYPSGYSVDGAQPAMYPPYYAPPHGYAAYPGMSWPHYTGYPPPQVPQPQREDARNTESDDRDAGGA
ncbi:Gti1/Pac2 family-domain-containing protein [Sparassis latifolia]